MNEPVIPMKTSLPIAALTAFAFFAIASAAVADETNSSDTKTKTCFQCSGTGITRCAAPSCLNGQSDCPAPCVKLRKGVWRKYPELNRPDPKELMQEIVINGHRWRVSSHHEGVRYVPKGAQEIEMVTCTVCNGSTRVQCKTCKGKGTVTCPVCGGKKTVPESWTAFDHPKMKERPSRFKMKDGSVLIGKKIMASGSTVVIRTEKGDEKLDAADIVAEEKQPTQK